MFASTSFLQSVAFHLLQIRIFHNQTSQQHEEQERLYKHFFQPAFGALGESPIPQLPTHLLCFLWSPVGRFNLIMDLIQTKRKIAVESKDVYSLRAIQGVVRLNASIKPTYVPYWNVPSPRLTYAAHIGL